MNIKIGRNEACICGSGKKFKYCCIDKDIIVENSSYTNEETIQLSKKFTEIKSKINIKLCFHPECYKNNKKESIKAHSIQRSTVLSALAENGMVYRFPYHNDKQEFILEGIGKVTTFYGFCKKHDKELFSPIEDYDFKLTNEQCFLFYYRNICHEFYNKLRYKNMIHEMIERYSDKMDDIEKQSHIIATDYAINNDFIPLKKLCDKYLLKKKFHKLYNKIIEIDYEIGFAAANCNNYLFDFDGNELFDVTSKKNFPLLSITVFPQNNKSYVIISTLKKHKKYYEFFFNKLDSMEKHEQLSLISSLMIRFSENTVFSKKLLNKFNSYQKKAFIKLFNETLDAYLNLTINQFKLNKSLNDNINLFIKI